MNRWMGGTVHEVVCMGDEDDGRRGLYDEGIGGLCLCLFLYLYMCLYMSVYVSVYSLLNDAVTVTV